MYTKSHDIYYKIFRLMSLKIDTTNLSNYSEEEILETYLTALITYTNSKLYELSNSLETYSNFETLIEKLYPYFKDDQEREFFYQQFGHSMLNIISFIKHKNIVWYSIKEDIFDMPIFVDNEFGIDFITLQKQSNKEIIIWLYNFINQKLLKQISFTKKQENRS